jgi:uncharacterized membrane protein YphA (DoxX/SURF4 family)
MLPGLLATAFFAVLFLQSGLDKVFDYKGNLEYFSGHFKKSPLSGLVGLLLPAIALLELATGIVSAIAFGQILWNGHSPLALFSPALAAVTLLCLFGGQRIAKDYAGAAGIVPYFLTALFSLWLLLTQ